jgi:16S rRNA (guanine527-N7)-methyltransferase
MAAPSIDLTLIESNVKKATFLSEVIRTLQLDHVTVFHGRMEDIKREIIPFDFLTARALGRHEELLNWAKTHLANSGKIVLWVGEDDANLISRKLGWAWRTPVLIPGSRRRYLLIGSPP